MIENVSVEGIVQIFTNLLVEKPVIIVGTRPEYMLPIVYSLSSLIHPFEIQYCLPLIKCEPEQYVEESALMIV
jgi:hypothetical protein